MNRPIQYAPGGFDRSAWGSNVRRSVFGPILFGAVVVVGFAGGFAVWGATAPIEGAVIAPGVVAASGQNHTVQHLEGGIVEQVLVDEGDRVEAGQPLIRLDQTAASSSMGVLQKRLVALEARAARLRAERDGVEKLAFPPDVLEIALKAELDGDVEEQRREFRDRMARHRSDLAIMDSRVAALNEQIAGIEAQIGGVESQIAVLADDVARKKKLLARKLTRIDEYNALRRQKADLEGRLGGFKAEIARARTGIVEAQEQSARLVKERAEQASSQLNEVIAQVADARERMRAAEDVLGRVVLRSPSDGVVVDIAKSTPGAVVNRGEDLMTILPTDNELIVEARLNPLDKDAVREGQQATLRFSALNQRTTPEVPAEVTFVGADALTDPQSRETYFVMRLAIADDLPDGLSSTQIFPGMPVETFVNTGDRTFFEYLAKPITDSMRKAFPQE